MIISNTHGMTKLDAAWLSGYIDSSGCFKILHNRASGNYSCKFVLKFRADAVELVNRIIGSTGIGHLEEEKAGRLGNPSALWVLSCREDCNALIVLLEQHPLRSNKRHDFNAWKAAVKFWTYKNAKNLTQWADLHAALIACRAYRSASATV